MSPTRKFETKDGKRATVRLPGKYYWPVLLSSILSMNRYQTWTCLIAQWRPAKPASGGVYTAITCWLQVKNNLLGTVCIKSIRFPRHYTSRMEIKLRTTTIEHIIFHTTGTRHKFSLGATLLRYLFFSITDFPCVDIKCSTSRAFTSLIFPYLEWKSTNLVAFAGFIMGFCVRRV